METLIVHTFSRRDIETLDFGPFDRLYGHWPQLWSRELRAKSNSMVFMIGGYDEDPSELYCIPEVRRFYRELHRRWPWWAFFLADTGGNLVIPYLCLLDSMEAAKRDGADLCSASIDILEIQSVLAGDFSRLAYLWDIARLPPAECERRMHSVTALFTGGGHG